MENTTRSDAVLAQARKELDVWSTGDTLGYGQFAADDVTYFHNVPALPLIDGKTALLEFLTTLQGQIPPHKYQLVDPKVQVYGEVGVLSLQYHAFTADGQLLVRGRGTCVYRETDSAWELVHTHWSGLDEA